MSSAVDTVRGFNRFYTRVIGVLGEGLLRTPFSLTEVRVLFELAQRDATEVTDLRQDLDLDAGYLSRMLTRFETDGLISRHRSDSDARRQTVRLTESGHATFDELDALAAGEIRQMLTPLAGTDQRRLLHAMGTIRQLLDPAPTATPAAPAAPATPAALPASPVPTATPAATLPAPAALPASPASTTYTLRGLRPGDLGWVVQRHGALYAEEYGWDGGFEALVARIVADFAADHDPERERGWIAEVAGEPAGCIFCMAKDDRTAQLRLLVVEPSARGLGIGARLVDECLTFAANAGYERITLWTTSNLASARHLYQRAGFTLDEEETRRRFGHDLTGQTWSRPLLPRRS